MRWDEIDQALAARAPTAVTTSARASWSWRRARSTGRNCPASRESRISQDTSSTPRAGITSTPAGTPTAGCTSCTTSASRCVGTGATGVQLVPHLGRDAKHLYVFQRTPSSVDVRGNKPTDPKWAASLQPGWQEERKRNFHRWSPLGEGVVFDQPDMVCDFWTELGRNLTARIARDGGSRLPDGRTDHGDARRRGLQGHGAAARRVETVVDDPDDRRGAQALLPVHVQAAVQQRRVPADLQPAERDAGRRVGMQRRRTGNGEGPRRQRRRVRGRLHHLCERVRDHHRDQPPLCHRRRSRAAAGCRCSTTGATATSRCTG